MCNFSIIIPFQQVSKYLYETLEHISKLKGPTYEVILLPDEEVDIKKLNKFSLKMKLIPTGTVSPAIKRDIGAEASLGQYLAFLDDDAYPAEDWLQKIIPHFFNTSIAAVGGPQITPESDNFWQQVSGMVFLSPLNGKAVYRYCSLGTPFFVDDWPTVNLIVRKEDFLGVGGFDNNYWPGEDTKLCHDLILNNNKIIYEPNAIVYHHRRAGFLRHLKQVGNYGYHRGHFVRKFPKTSLRIPYFFPTCFFLFTCFGWIFAVSFNIFLYIYFLLWGVYFAGLIYSFIKLTCLVRRPFVALASVPYIISTHFWYGYKFLKGLTAKTIISKLGR